MACINSLNLLKQMEILDYPKELVKSTSTSNPEDVADATLTIYPVPEANKHTVTTVQYYFNYTALNCITLSCIYTTAGHVHCTAYILA